MTHVDKPVDTEDGAPLELHSALHDTTGEQDSLREVIVARECELRETLETLRKMQIILDSIRERCNQLEGELVGVKAALEKKKVKKIWREICELQLSHEDVLGQNY